MSLDRDVIEIIQMAIEADLAAPKVPKQRLPKLKKTWKCQYAHEFLYGHRAGYYKGLAEGIIMERYKRRISPDEDNQIFDLTNTYTSKLRMYFAYYKGKNAKVLSKNRRSSVRKS